nr:sensor histidine kinase [Lachnospiraceae bacterium]
MNKKLISIAIFYIIIIAFVSLILIQNERANNQKNIEQIGEFKVATNAIIQSINAGENDKAISLIDELNNDYNKSKNIEKNSLAYIVSMLISIAGIITMFIYIDYSILKPFRELKDYANEVSKGNLDKPLIAKRGNFFGDFTWAFDNMRKEIVKARASERAAIDNNKTVIATLSHDIKTPISSIRAYSEAFEANMDSSPEKRQKYLSILMEKCDEVTKLTNDLFLHSISEMNRLEIKKEEFDLVEFIDTDIRQLFV